MTNTFPNAVITNSSGIPVMVAGPSSAAAGTLVAPQFTNPPFVSDVQNSFPTLGAYFAAVKNAQPGRKAKIKDFIGQSGGSNKPTYFFYYDFDLTVTASNSLRLEGSLFVTNAPASLGTFWTNATNLVLEIGADAGPNDSWASSAVYLAPTPANYVSVAVSNNLTNGALTGYLTNVLAYSGYASNGLAGQNVSITGTNLLGTVQVAFSGASNTLVPSPLIVSTNMTNISAVVPFAAVNGPIVVTTTNGSGKSANNFFVIGATNADGYTNAVPGGSNAPIITGFSPTNGKAATTVFAIEGDWLAIATNSETGPTNANPTLPDLYQSSFGTSIMGRIMGDLAAGLALGFINSTNTNPYYTTNAATVVFGDSPSGSWWGGNEYPAGGSNSMSYSQVNTTPQLSQWGSLIQTATAVTYGHPIYDRMQYFAGTNPLQIQPASATNNIPNIWVVEIEFFNGMASVGSKAPSSVLTYNNWLTNYPFLTNTNRTADPDGDGFDNNKEYAFGGNPTVGTPALLAMSAANVSFIALNNATTNYTVQNTTNLLTGPWTNYAATVTNATNQLNIPLPAYYQRQEFTVPLIPGTNNFYRVIFTNQ